MNYMQDKLIYNPISRRQSGITTVFWHPRKGQSPFQSPSIASVDPLQIFLPHSIRFTKLVKRICQPNHKSYVLPSFQALQNIYFNWHFCYDFCQFMMSAFILASRSAFYRHLQNSDREPCLKVVYRHGFEIWRSA